MLSHWRRNEPKQQKKPLRKPAKRRYHLSHFQSGSRFQFDVRMQIRHILSKFCTCESYCKLSFPINDHLWARQNFKCLLFCYKKLRISVILFYYCVENNPICLCLEQHFIFRKIIQSKNMIFEKFKKRQNFNFFLKKSVNFIKICLFSHFFHFSHFFVNWACCREESSSRTFGSWGGGGRFWKSPSSIAKKRKKSSNTGEFYAILIQKHHFKISVLQILTFFNFFKLSIFNFWYQMRPVLGEPHPVVDWTSRLADVTKNYNLKMFTIITQKHCKFMIKLHVLWSIKKWKFTNFWSEVDKRIMSPQEEDNFWSGKLQQIRNLLFGGGGWYKENELNDIFVCLFSLQKHLLICVLQISLCVLHSYVWYFLMSTVLSRGRPSRYIAIKAVCSRCCTLSCMMTYYYQPGSDLF